MVVEGAIMIKKCGKMKILMMTGKKKILLEIEKKTKMDGN